MTRTRIRIFRSTLPIDLLAVTFFASSIALIYGGVRAFYFGSEFLAPIAYATDESISAEIVAPLLGAGSESLLLGRHLFFDFFISYYWGQLPNPWFNNGLDFWPNHAPLAMLVGRAWGALDYALARDLNVILMALSAAAVGVISLARRRWSVVLIGTSVLVLSGPSIAALDRGNYQGYIPLLLLGFGIAVLRNRWGWAGFFLATAASFKMYPIILLLVFVAERRWKALAGTVLGAAAGNFLLLFFFEGPPWESGLEFVKQASLILGQSSQELTIYNTSLTGGTIHWLQLLGISGLAAWLSTNAWVVALLGTAVLGATLWFRTRVPLVIRLISALMLTTTMTTHSFPYTLNWAIAAAGLLFLSSNLEKEANPPEAQGLKQLRLTTTVAIGLLLGFYPVFIPGTAEVGYPAGASSLVAPISFAIFTIGIYVHARRKESTLSGSPPPLELDARQFTQSPAPNAGNAVSSER